MQGSDKSVHIREGSSHRQTRLLLFTGFGGLLVLMGLLGIGAITFLQQIEARESGIRKDYVRADRALEALRSSIYNAGTNLRDFLLDESPSGAAIQRQKFEQKRLDIQRGIAAFESLANADERVVVERLKEEQNGFFEAAAPVLTLGPAQRRAVGYAFMRNEVLPRRKAALDLVNQIQQIGDKQLNANAAAVSDLIASFRTRLILLLLFTFLVGLGLAAAALWRLLRLESESRERFREVMTAREELKRLSGELVTAQEHERRRISRELHDEVGQVLSAIVLGIENLRSALQMGDEAEAFRQLELLQTMTARNVSVVRNISLLLRPTMLDDLGLIPAVRWLAREVSRAGSMDVEVLAEEFQDELPDEHRTCVFRVVQEALRNASRHSGARRVRIDLRQEEGRLAVSVEDNGQGFRPGQNAGLGILGMQERVRRLGGELRVDSEPGRGATLTFALPLKK